MSLDHAATKPHERLAAALSDEMAAVNVLIRDRMASEHAPRIPEVTAHLVEAGGKRLRPMLTLAAAKLCGYDGPYQLMTETGSLDVLRILSNASATIAEGEVLQLTAAQDLATTEAIYLQVVRGKTAALFSAAMEVGGVIANQDAAIVQALFDYGDALGVGFQIVDDLLDYAGTDATGKNIGDDFRERKLTLPVIKAVALADEEERAFWTRTIEKGKQDDGDLDVALGLLAKHKTLEATRLDALDWMERAKTALAPLPDHDIKSMLIDLADYVVARVR